LQTNFLSTVPSFFNKQLARNYTGSLVTANLQTGERRRLTVPGEFNSAIYRDVNEVAQLYGKKK
jgi:hypothetical protein